MTTLWHHLRFALRGLFKAPGFTAVTALTLALGIGATTGVFSVLRAVLLASMPYPEPDRLIYAVTTSGGRATGLSPHDYLDYRDQATCFTSLAAHLQYTDRVPSTGGDRPETVNITFVSTDLFRTLGVTPSLGRDFVVEEGKPAPVPGPNQPRILADVAIISHAFWQRRFGGSPEAVGKQITLQGQPVSVVGVMPEGFRFMVDADVWAPLRLNGWHATARRFRNWAAVGRLRDGVTLEQAQAEMSAIAKRLEAAYPDCNTGKGVRLSGLHDAFIARLRPQVLLIGAAVALMLLIACGNVANLLLARGVTRRSELAMRVALGASRRRLLGQLVTESTVLAVAGGVLGLAVAAALQRLLPVVLDFGASRLGAVALRLDPGVLAFALGVSILTGIGVGIVPALRATRVSLSEELKGSSRTVTSHGGARLRMVLVASQVSVSLVLLIGASLLVRSFARLSGVQLGFDPEQVVSAELALPASVLALPASVSREAALAFFTAVLADTRALPGVAAAGMVDRLPVLHPGGSNEVWHPDRANERSFSQQALGRVVLPGYFSAMRMPLVAGRDVAEADRTGTPQVVVISETMARTIFKGQTAVGRQVAADLGDSQPTLLEVVGVVADARLDQLGDGPSMVMYFPYHQAATLTMQVAIRTTSEPEGVTRALRELVWRRDKNVPVADLSIMKGAIRRSTMPQQTLAGSVSVFSLLALLLAAVGLFGVLAYQVSQREHEIGIRVALGARRTHILKTVLRQGLVVTAAGLVVGAVAGLALTRLMSSLLFEVSPADPASLLAATGCLLGVALAACLVPAARARGVQPVQALRYE